MKKIDKILNGSKYLIDDDLITDFQSDDIEERVMSHLTPWYATKESQRQTVDGLQGMAYSMLGKPVIDGPQMVHRVVHDGEVKNQMHFQIGKVMTDLICKKYDIDELGLYRMKINYQHNLTGNKEGAYNTPHYDQTFPHLAMIYYVDDSDGDTYIFKDAGLEIIEKVSPKKGRCLFLDGRTLHTGQHPITSLGRVVINFNWVD